MQSLEGHFLIANYALQDPNFSRSVVFLVEHNEEGAFGLVINRPEETTLEDVLDEIPDAIKKQRIFQGGPVQPRTLFILHSDSLVSSPGEEVYPGVFLGAELNLLRELAEAESDFHVYHGYSGWGPGQLEAEMLTKAWIPIEVKPDLIFHPRPEDAWREALKKGGGIYEYFARNVRDPFLN